MTPEIRLAIEYIFSQSRPPAEQDDLVQMLKNGKTAEEAAEIDRAVDCYRYPVNGKNPAQCLDEIIEGIPETVLLAEETATAEPAKEARWHGPFFLDLFLGNMVSLNLGGGIGMRDESGLAGVSASVGAGLTGPRVSGQAFYSYRGSDWDTDVALGPVVEMEHMGGEEGTVTSFGGGIMLSDGGFYLSGSVATNPPLADDWRFLLRLGVRIFLPENEP